MAQPPRGAADHLPAARAGSREAQGQAFEACRAYLLRTGKLAQLTQDHTLVARMVQLGQLTPKEAANHPRKNELTQAIGKNADVKPDVNTLQLASGDCLVLASDGLHADLEEKTLQLEMVRPAASAVDSSPGSFLPVPTGPLRCRLLVLKYLTSDSR